VLWLALWIIATGASQSKQQARELGKLDWPSLGTLLRLSPFSPFGIVFPYRTRHLLADKWTNLPAMRRLAKRAHSNPYFVQTELALPNIT
jgi:hypothetical protein